MDPLSVSASVIAVVGATGKLIKGVRRLKALKEAPRELDDLLAEISQFELVIQAVQNTHENNQPGLKKLLGTATEILVEFESLIEYNLTEAGTSDKVDHWQWTRRSKDVERLRGRLRDVTANVVALVSVSASTTIHQVAQNTNQALSEHRKLGNQILSAYNILVQLLEESPSTRVALTESLGNVRQLTVRSPNQETDTLTEETQWTTYQGVPATHRIQSQTMLNISKTQKVSVCDVSCRCKCHFQRRCGNPWMFSTIFGHAYVQTAGLNMLGAKCDAEPCIAQAALRVSVQYRLPQWLASRMIFMWFTSSPPCGPELLLRVPRVLTWDNLACRAIKFGDVDILKLAITRGDCSPYDVDEQGHSLLEEQLAILRYLSSQDDYRNSSTVSSWIADYIFSVTTLYRPLGFESNVEWQYLVLNQDFAIVDWDRYAMMKSFTSLHQIATGISGASLDLELQDSMALDRLDEDGRSALWYAVRTQRTDHVCKLLEKGADPNIGDPPLWTATQTYPSLEITRMLLDHGASLSPDLIPPSSDGWLPWSLWGSDDDLTIDRLLIDYGININYLAVWRGVKDTTILMRLSFASRFMKAPQRLQQLIGFGADLEITDEQGRTAIMYAAMNASGGAFRILESAGARLDLKTVNGSTILHLAIVETTEYYRNEHVGEFCGAMRDTDLTSIDLNAEDEDGHKAYDLLKIRNGPSCLGYCASKGLEIWCCLDWQLFEPEAVRALEGLLHHIQDMQGVPETDQYPPLGE